MRASTNLELSQLASKIKYFRGVFSRDTLPKKPYIFEKGILNLQTESGAGTHWVAYSKIKNKVFYFDSFGNLPPPIEFIKYMSSNKIFYNRLCYQEYKDVNCGLLCIKFLKNQTLVPIRIKNPKVFL